MNICYNMDCAELLCQLPDKEKNKRTVLAIVDPPYGIKKSSPPTRIKKYGNVKICNDKKPDKIFFKELFRVSQNQIIWGYNHLSDLLPSCKEYIFWYKHQPVNTYAVGELAYTNFNYSAKLFDYPYFGSIGADKIRIHPNQKPVALYRWLLTNYAKPGWLILDTHVGSGSIRIACHDLGFDFIGTENDYDYWQAQEKRYRDYIAQGELPGMGEEIRENIFEQGEL